MLFVALFLHAETLLMLLSCPSLPILYCHHQYVVYIYVYV